MFMMDSKKKLRNDTIEKLYHMSHGQYDVLCERISDRLTKLSFWQDAKTIGLTVSRQREINTQPIIETAWQEGKAVVVPKTDPKAKTMDFREIGSYDQLEAAYAGIQEPIVNVTRSVSPLEIDLLVVPGLLFDFNGYRIGFGGGFYDRYLTMYSNTTVSLAFEMQTVDQVPKEPFDRPVDYIVTEEKVIKTKML
jgi:5-formyltetrahydrofolate cyclo-ligase